MCVCVWMDGDRGREGGREGGGREGGKESQTREREMEGGKRGIKEMVERKRQHSSIIKQSQLHVTICCWTVGTKFMVRHNTKK